MSILSPDARAVLESDALAHLVTLNKDGSPQVSCIWVGLDGDELVGAHLAWQQKLRNIERDPRVTLSLEAPGANAIGLRHYLVVPGPLGSRRAARRSSCVSSPRSTSGREPSFRRCPTRLPAIARGSRSSGSAGSAPGPGRRSK